MVAYQRRSVRHPGRMQLKPIVIPLLRNPAQVAGHAGATLLHGPDDGRPVSAGRRRSLPDLTSDAYLAFQAEPGPPPPYSKAEAPGLNWREYDASLRQRGSLMVWFTDEAIEAWRAEPRTTPGGQPWYSPLAILTALTLRAVFRLALRQTDGLIGSVIGLLGLALSVPDHSMLSRRAETLEVPRPQPRRDGEPLHLLVDSTGLKLCGAGKWLVEKHGAKTRRSWRKLHIGLDGVCCMDRDGVA